MAGDIYNVRAKVDIEVQNHLLDVMEAFHAAGIKVLVIAGNHDQYDNSDSPANATRAFRNIPGFTGVDSEGVVTLEEGEEVIKVLCVPYNKDTDRLKGAINLFVEENPGDTSSILAGHLGSQVATKAHIRCQIPLLCRIYTLNTLNTLYLDITIPTRHYLVLKMLSIAVLQ